MLDSEKRSKICVKAKSLFIFETFKFVFVFVPAFCNQLVHLGS